jgi:hypothetical protein
MPKLVLKSEVSENIELLTQIAEKLGFEVTLKGEKSKKNDKSKKKEQYVFSKKDKSSSTDVKVVDEDLEEDELSESTKDSETSNKKLAKVKIKKSGKDKKKSKGYYELDDDFMKDF